MTDLCETRSGSFRPSRRSSPLARAVAAWRQWRTQACRRKALETLLWRNDPRMLADIGLETVDGPLRIAPADRADPSREIVRLMVPSPWWDGGNHPLVELWLRDRVSGDGPRAAPDGDRSRRSRR
jgi:uncharacterized protein YjiS (DUF1127 family)